jgi:hypothetical protein
VLARHPKAFIAFRASEIQSAVRTVRCRLCRSIRSVLWLSGEWKRHDANDNAAATKRRICSTTSVFVREIILLSAATKQFIEFRALSAVSDG